VLTPKILITLRLGAFAVNELFRLKLNSENKIKKRILQVFSSKTNKKIPFWMVDYFQEGKFIKNYSGKK